MKKYILFLAAVLLSAACTPEEITSNFNVGGPEGLFVDGGFVLSGNRLQVPLTLTTDNPKAQCSVSTPADQQWCVCYQDEVTGEWWISVAPNPSVDPRSTYIFIKCGETTQKVTVWQDYLKTLAFVNKESTVDAASGVYSIPLKTNLPDSEINIQIDPACTWITGATVVDGILTLTVLRNDSTTQSRFTAVTIISGAMRDVANVTQIAMSGFPYVIPIGSLNFMSYPLYEIFDNDHNVKIGEVCKEYLYKHDALENKDIVNGSFTVVYPMKDGEVDYTKGLVVNNGGMVVWDGNSISNYFAGTGTSDGNVYMPSGSTQMRLEPLDPSETGVITAVCNPVTVTVTRTGAADNHGRTTETYNYTVVKIGTQYWMRENFKSSRFADGSPIPTNIDAAGWVANTTPVLKPMCLTAGAGGTYVDANSDGGLAVRDDAGCLYTYAALVNREINVSGSKAATFVKEDRISPDGWAVPSLNDMKQLYSYMKQKEYATTKAETDELLPRLLKSGNNVSGFSAVGTRQRGYTGNYNNILYYMTMGYSYEAGHVVYQLRLNSGSTMICTLTSAGGTYLRLIRKTQ